MASGVCVLREECVIVRKITLVMALKTRKDSRTGGQDSAVNEMGSAGVQHILRTFQEQTNVM